MLPVSLSYRRMPKLLRRMTFAASNKQPRWFAYLLGVSNSRRNRQFHSIVLLSYRRTPKLLRRMTFAASNKQPILEVDYQKVLAGLQLTHAQFVDLCILCGCDYTDRSALFVDLVVSQVFCTCDHELQEGLQLA